MKIKYNSLDFYITYVSEDQEYVLGTYNEDKETKIFKLDTSLLNLTDKEKTALTKINSKI